MQIRARVWNAIPQNGSRAARWKSMENGRRTSVTAPKLNRAQTALKMSRRVLKRLTVTHKQQTRYSGK